MPPLQNLPVHEVLTIPFLHSDVIMSVANFSLFSFFAISVVMLLVIGFNYDILIETGAGLVKIMVVQRT